MLYAIIKQIIKLSAYFFFSEKSFIDLERLKTNKPLLVCANHASAFLDAMLIMIYSKRKYYVLVRADVFQKKFARWLLSRFNLIPIYRMRDGINQLERNNETFEKCLAILNNNGAIIIFPEANCIMERKLRKLQKGAARIAFQAEEESHFQLGLEIVTVGITYERLKYYGGKLFIKVSEPFSIGHFKSLYKVDKNDALQKVTNQIENDLAKNMMQVFGKEDEYLWERSMAWKTGDVDFEFAQSLSKNINLENVELKKALCLAIKTFESHMKNVGVNRKTFVKLANQVKWRRYFNLFVRSVDCIALSPFFIIGFLFNSIPFYLPLYLSKVFFKDEPEYHNSISLAGSALLFLASYLCYALLSMYFISSILITLGCLILIAISGLISYQYLRNIKELLSTFHFIRLNISFKKEWNKQYKIISEELAQF